MTPFTTSHSVPVDGGTLYVAQSGPAPQDARRVVFAAHGITASHLNWLTVARLIDDDVCLLAADLRGRGASREVGPPYGIATHVADVVTVLDHLELSRVVLAGHSMGAWVVGRTAAEHPERASDVILVDGGLSVPMPDGADPDAVLDAVLGPAIARLSMTFGSPEEYLAFFAAHPAFAAGLDDDVEAYVRYDLMGEPGAMHSRAAEAAVRADGTDLLLDATTRTAVERIAAPITLIRAERGLLNDDNPLIPQAMFDAFLAAHPEVTAHDVPDVNHYDVVLGGGGSAALVARALAGVSTPSA